MKLLFTLVLTLAISLGVQAQNIGQDICPLKVGSEIPEATVKKINGEQVSIKTIAEAGPTVIVFFRGGWCPYCQRHLSALQEVEEDMKSLGYTLVALTPDKPENLHKSIDKNDLTYELFSDHSMAASDAFGLSFTMDEKTKKRYDTYGLDMQEWSGESHYKLPVPAVYIVKKGVVTFQYVNPTYKTRLDAQTLLAMLRSDAS